MTKESISNNVYSSSPLSTSSAPLRWMPRFMCKSSPFASRKSTTTFSVASITKVHTFGKLKQQHSHNNMMDKTGESSSSNDNCNHSSRIKLHQLHQRHRYSETNNSNHGDISDGMESILAKLPIELIQDILTHLDCVTLYQLCLSCSEFRRLLRNTTMVWRTLTVDSNLPSNYQQDSLELYKLVCFMITNGIHVQVNSLIMDGCTFLDPVLLDTLIRAYPNLIRLSLAHCPQIGCWQILHMLRASIKGNYQLAMLAKQHCNTDEEEQQQSPIGDGTEYKASILLATLQAIKHPHQQQATLFSRTGLSDTTHPPSSLSPTSETSTRSLSTRDHILGFASHRSRSQHTNNSNDNNNNNNNTRILPYYDLLPCLKHLKQLNMEGAFPSERSYKSHTHEMYCFGEIKKALLQLGYHQDNENAVPAYQQLSEAHYALYQFWLLLRSHMLRWDNGGQDTLEQQQHYYRPSTPTDPLQQQQPQQPQQPRRWQDFRPPWLPDTLVQFIQITEQDQPSSSVKIDLAPCVLCHRNVAPPSQYPRSLCYACHAPTPMVCAQCRCHSCHAVLCSRCHLTQQARFRQSSSNQPSQTSASPTIWTGTSAAAAAAAAPTTPTTATSTATAVSTATLTTTTSTVTWNPDDIVASLSSWRTLHCQRCHLPRRICGQSSCVDQLENNKQHRWTCVSCQKQQKCVRQRKAPPRFFEKAKHWSYWI